MKAIQLCALPFYLFCLIQIAFSSDQPLDFLKNTKADRFEYPHYNEDGILVWILKGREPTFIENDDILVSEPTITFYEKKGQAIIKADKAIFVGKNKICKMSGNVRANNVEGYQFQSQQADFFLELKKIVFPSVFSVKLRELQFKSEDGYFDMNQKILKSKGTTELEYQP